MDINSSVVISENCHLMLFIILSQIGPVPNLF